MHSTKSTHHVITITVATTTYPNKLRINSKWTNMQHLGSVSTSDILISLRMGFGPGRRALLFVCLFSFWTFVTATTPVLFCKYFFYARYIWKNKVGLITKQAHVFLTNTSQYFYLPKSFDQLQWLIYACYDGNLSQVSQVSECTIRTACQQTLN